VAEIAGDMARVRCLLEIRLMALIAIGIHQLIVAVGVARLASRRRMRPRQWEAGRGVIERRWPPDCRRMTLGAIVAEVPGYVIRIRRLLEIRRMTLIAVSVLNLIVAVHVARLARCCSVRAREREIRARMIERRRSPCRCCVALCAVVTEVACHVVRICYSLKV